MGITNEKSYLLEFYLKLLVGGSRGMLVCLEREIVDSLLIGVIVVESGSALEEVVEFCPEEGVCLVFS